MKSVIDSYIGLWLIMLFLVLCIAFTSINLNVVQARKMYNDIKSQVQASNGINIPASGEYTFDSTTTNDETLKKTKLNNGYEYKYTIERKKMTADSNVLAQNETWIYNDIYKISLVYTYSVPLFGTQVYPIEGYTY